MTPAELAKVRVALSLASRRMSPGFCEVQGVGVQMRNRDHALDLCAQALAILDREAKRKTLTYLRIQRRGLKNVNDGGWFTLRACCETQAVADVEIAAMREFHNVDASDMRILEVTESWEEPKP